MLKQNPNISWDSDTGTNVNINNIQQDPNHTIVDLVVDAVEKNRKHTAFDNFLTANNIQIPNEKKTLRQKKRGGGGCTRGGEGDRKSVV